MATVKLGSSSSRGEASTPPQTPERAIERGVAYLRQRLLDGSQLYSSGDPYGGGAHPGAVALAGLTLLECGLPPDDPGVHKAITTVRSQAPTLGFTYSLAVAILFLDRLNDPKERPVDPSDRELIRRMALRLIANQNFKGGWSYRCQMLTPEREESLLNELRQNRYTPGAYFPLGQPNGLDDNSIAQFAMLALWAARKHGVPVRQVLKVVEARYRAGQNPDGSWNYRDQTPFLRDTSTCAGLIGLAVARGAEDDEQPKTRKPAGPDIRQDPAVQKALRYLGGVVGKAPEVPEAERQRRRDDAVELERVKRALEVAAEAEKPLLYMQFLGLSQASNLRGIYVDGDHWGNLYFLWSVERMAVIYDLKDVEGTDWYRWGSQIILTTQQADGSWAERFSGVPDTCFALLFLKRANVVKDLTDKLRRARLGLPAAAAPRPERGSPPQPARKE
jgi:hypothetical protein